MTLAIVYSRAAVGIDAPLVTVEVHLANGLPALSIVGLPEAAVRESKDRVRSALLTSGFEFPARRITVNLAPADLPKEGGRFDLPIALGILAASGQLRGELGNAEFLGELALSGALRAIPGTLPCAIQSKAADRDLFVPEADAGEASLVYPERTRGARHLLDVCAHLNGATRLAPFPPAQPSCTSLAQDMRDVRGQQTAKRCLEISAAGGHSLLMVGPPGTGKSMLADRLSGILPPMTEAEALEAAAVASVSGEGFQATDWGTRPYRHPHHSASQAALIGGGSRPRPGEISLAHNGVLFLDELPEFSRNTLEALREPLESGHVVVSRVAARVTYPARFQLIAAMNPCPCGYLGDSGGRCRCTCEQVDRYRGKLSGPVLDRIDLAVDVPRLPTAVLQNAPDGEDSATVRERVVQARERQLRRCATVNRDLRGAALDCHCRLTAADRRLLETAMERLGLSARAYHRILRVARTIADLAGRDAIQTEHLTEALSYRGMDRRLTPGQNGGRF